MSMEIMSPTYRTLSVLTVQSWYRSKIYEEYMWTRNINKSSGVAEQYQIPASQSFLGQVMCAPASNPLRVVNDAVGNLASYIGHYQLRQFYKFHAFDRRSNFPLQWGIPDQLHLHAIKHNAIPFKTSREACTAPPLFCAIYFWARPLIGRTAWQGRSRCWDFWVRMAGTFPVLPPCSHTEKTLVRSNFYWQRIHKLSGTSTS